VRAAAAGLSNIRFVEGDASDLRDLADGSFDLVVSVFGAMLAPRPFDTAREMIRVTRPGGRIVMGNWIPGDPTLVAQVPKVSAAYSPPPPPPEGFISPVTWGQAAHVVERFGAAGIPESMITCEPRTSVFQGTASASVLFEGFRDFYGPTMNAFEAAGRDGRADALEADLRAVFDGQNQGGKSTFIPAAYLHVTVTKR